MTDINSSNQNESKEELQKRENSFNDLIKRKTKKLAKDKIKEDWFYPKFKWNKYTSNDFKWELFDSLSETEKNKYEKLIDSIDSTKIDELFSMFSDEIRVLSFQIENRKNELQNYYISKYELDDTKIKKLNNQLDLFSEGEINELIKGIDKKREEVLINLFWKSKVKLKKVDVKREIKEILSWTDISEEIKNREIKDILSWVDISEEIKNRIVNKIWVNSYNNSIEELRELFNRLKSLKKIDLSIVFDLFEKDIFSEDDKKFFLSKFVPFLSLWDLIKTWIYSEIQWKDKIKDDLIKHWNKSENEINYIIENIDFNDYIVKSSDIINYLNSNQLDSLAWNISIAKTFVDTYNKSLEWLRESYLNSIDNLALFKEKIHSTPQIQRKISSQDYKNIDTLLNDWIIIRLSTKDNERSKEESYTYLEIKSFQDDWTFTFCDRSSKENSYNNSSTLEISTWYYASLFYIINNNLVTKIDFFTSKEIKSKINSWEINESWDDINFKDQSDFDFLTARKNEIKEELNKMSHWKTLDELEANKEVTNLIYELDDIDNKLWINLESYNFNFLLEKIDLLDPNWKDFWLKEWVTIKASKSWSKLEWDIFTITEIDKNTKKITVENAIWQLSTWSFEEFYSLFKDHDIKRISNNTDFSKIPELATKNEKLKMWWDFEVKNDKIVKKESETWITYDYLVATKDGKDELVKIHSVNWNKVKISFWKILDEKEVKTDDYAEKEKKEKKWEIFETENETYEVSVSFLEDYIKSKKLEPRALNEANDKKKGKLPDWVDRKWSFSKWLFSNKSVAEIIKWVKIWFDSIQHYLKEWNEEHANAVALSVFGKFLPIELESDLRTRVEQWEKKHMDEYIWKLKSVDSPIATWMIEKWLLTSNTPNHKKEAWLLFMMESYWTLYAKKLYKYKWKFLWYEALGWHIWDELYRETEEKAKKAWIQFSEEELVHTLLKLQCKPWWDPKTHIHRRSRIHKEFEWSWKWWMKKDKEKWLEDSKWKRTVDWRIAWWIDELKWWTYPNAMWWFEWIIWKWWPMHKMNKLPFVMLFSWIAYNFNQKMADEFKNSMSEWRIIPAARFISLTSDIDLFNQTVLELSKRFKDLYWDKEEKYKNMLSRAEKIINNQWSKNEPDQIDATVSFFDDYWEILTKSMYMLNDWKNDEYSLSNKIIFLEKDSNPVFKKYYDLFRNYNKSDANFTVDDYMSDAFVDKWISWLDLFKFTKEALSYNQWWWFYKSKFWHFALEEVETEFLTLLKRNYSNEKNEDINIKKTILKQNLREFLSWILASHAWNQNAIEAINKPWSHFSKIFDKFWIDLTEFRNNNINAEQLLEWKNIKAERILERYINNWLDWKDHSVDRWVTWVINFTWWSIADALKKEPINDEDFQKVA